MHGQQNIKKYAKYNRNLLTASENEILADGLGWPYVFRAKKA